MAGKLDDVLDYLDRLFHPERGTIVATLADLEAAVARIDADIQALIAAITPVDFQAQVDALNAAATSAEAAVPPPPTPAA